MANVKAENLKEQHYTCRVCEKEIVKCLCTDCGDLFCQSCKNLHKEQTATKGHRVEDLTSLPADEKYVVNPSDKWPSSTNADEQPLWCFHGNHGSNIELSNNRQTATRMTEDLANGVLLSLQPMEEMVVYEVVIDEIDDNLPYPALGILTQSPDTLPLPRRAWLLTSGVAISAEWVYINGDEIMTNQFSVLDIVRKDDTIGVMVDSQRRVHMIHNGEDLGVTIPEYRVPQNANAFVVFEVWGRLKKVTTLPLRKVQDSS